MDQDRDGTAGEIIQDQFADAFVLLPDVTPPRITSVTDIALNELSRDSGRFRRTYQPGVVHRRPARVGRTQWADQ